uniref:Paramyosin-like n=1 Tax=Nicotiana tabacum TaxID=4097 RepID=A0A1S3YV40_TOBAC|nr:PREDICTED: paramyosin-like [Nicotiana tabacum]
MTETVAGMPATVGIVDEIPNFRGFSVRGISAEAVRASRISLERAHEIILGSSSKRKAASDQDSEKEEDGGSLAIMTASIIPPSTTPSSTVPYSKVGSSSRSGAMRRVTIEVPTEGNLLRKSGQADVWLKTLIGPVERAKLDSHSSVTLMNDIVHASLKVNLIGTKMMKRVTLLEQLVRDYQVEADNWKEQCESLQIDVKTLEESKFTLEQQVRALNSELAVEKASSNQADKEKAHLETSFSKQLSKESDEIRELRDLLGEKEAYAGELMQNLTQTQEDLRISSDKVCSLENSHASLQASYESTLAENKKLRNEIADWERDY